MARPKRIMEDRFWEKVDRGSDDECWPWTAFRGVKGYGQFSPDSSCHAQAHRVAWELTNGPIPEGVLRGMGHSDWPEAVKISRRNFVPTLR